MVDEIFQCSITHWNTSLPQRPSYGVMYYYLKAIAPKQPISSWILPLKFGVGWKKTGKRERNCKYKFIKTMVFNIRNA